MISVVINSAALGPKSRALVSSGGKIYGERATLLRDRILPASAEADEVIVVGEFESGPGYIYVPSPSQAFDCTDALHQRQAGFVASRGEILVFQHDDHCADPAFFETLRRYASDTSWDVLVPDRHTMDGKRLDTGAHGSPGVDESYVMGHACVMRRAMVERAPWSDVSKVITWDVVHTRQLRSCGARIRWVDDLVMFNLETLGEYDVSKQAWAP